MGKKKNKRVAKFKKFVGSIVDKLGSLVENNKKGDAVIFLMKSGESGVSYVKGDPLAIHILLEETAQRDEMFATVLKQVASRVNGIDIDKFSSIPEEKKSRDFPTIEVDGSNVQVGSIGLTMEEIDKMSDKELEVYLDKFSNDVHDKFKEEDEDDEEDSSEE
tara:strand:- start:881 stop:1366 length:486 start_codon:yes stop_codon:yes gene_type:complete